MKTLNPQKTKKYKIVAFLLLALLYNVSNAQNTNLIYSENSLTTNELSQSNFQPERNINCDNENFINVNYSFEGLRIKNETVGNVSYQKLIIDGYGQLNEVGKPSLPSHTDLIAIPENSNPTIIIEEVITEEYSGYMIFPALEPAIDTKDAKNPEFVIDNNTYNTNEYYPENIVRIVDIQKLRGMPIAMVNICPVQFNPVTGKIKVYKKIKYRIQYNGGTKSYNRLERESSENFKKILQNVVINRSALPPVSKTKSSPDSKDYIIITTTAYAAAADTLAKWKSQMGYKVDVVTKSSWTAVDVKDSIHTRYQNWTPKPDYFVIIGDQADVPAEIHSAPNNVSFVTDLYYACMDGTGDYFPDMAHGRISVTSAAQALTTIQKIVDYERNPIVDANFYSTGVNFGEFQDDNLDGYSNRRFTHTNEDIHDYLVNNGYTMNRQYFANSNVTPTNYNNGYYSNGEAIPSAITRANSYPWTATQGHVWAELNAGKFLAVHRGHGYEGGWGWVHPMFVSHPYYNHINTLTNGRKLPVVISIDCYSGDFNTSECLAENFLRKTDGGAVGVFAASFYSYSGPNDGLAAGLIDAIWANPGLVPSFGAGGISNPTLSTHNDIHTMGDVLNQGLLRMVETWTGSTIQNQYTYELFHYHGDPAMKIWTASPTTVTATHLSTLPKNANFINISNSNCTNGIATIYANGELLGKTTLMGGNGTIEFVCLDTVQAILSITGENFRPYLKKIQINNNIESTPPIMQAKNLTFSTPGKTSTSLEINWTNGDGDRRLVKINTANSFIDPVDGVEYSADRVYSGAGEQIVYNDFGSSVVVTNLIEGVTYWFRVYEYNNFGVFTIYTTTTETNNPANPEDGGGALPIELISFNASYNGQSVELNWATATETNNNYFTIQRAEDAETFIDITNIPGAGTSNSLINYVAQDEFPNNNIEYYRLKQTDFNGNFDYSEIISVNCNDDNAFKIVNIIDNNNGSLSVIFNSNSTQNINYRLFNTNGQQVISMSDSNLNKGINEISLNTSNLNQGIYVLSLQNEQTAISKNIVIQ
ncbi:MAG: T9SS type A sorting domain-containing protein [Saprospiraceae bacterium]|nr:T9SS type A sorting domain-containing protein [Saprospiraceae bacterium]